MCDYVFYAENGEANGEREGQRWREYSTAIRGRGEVRGGHNHERVARVL